LTRSKKRTHNITIGYQTTVDYRVFNQTDRIPEAVRQIRLAELLLTNGDDSPAHSNIPTTAKQQKYYLSGMNSKPENISGDEFPHLHRYAPKVVCVGGSLL
jgi:hypothetical protein